MSEHPYKTLPDKAFWKRSVARPERNDVDPVGEFNIRIEQDTKVATAGSCFAQHIARYLKNSGFCYYVTEPGHPILSEATKVQNNYGLYSARYGNIYTARQLLQLFQRAYGLFTPQEDVWQEADDVFLDPFRPSSQPGGFISEAEMRADRAQHLAAVRHMFETLDIFVFTLGLTECWRSMQDGAVFPICPGVEGGTFDPSRHQFYNQTADDVVRDFSTFLFHLARVNPKAQIILTVSPVPLMATAEPGAHVLSATTYSKSVLRVAAETLRRQYDHVHYFPSYEVITGSYNRGAYYAGDMRNVLEDGVSHVMRLFMHYASERYSTDNSGAPTLGPSNVIPPAPALAPSHQSTDAFLAQAQRLVEVECDEIGLDKE